MRMRVRAKSGKLGKAVLHTKEGLALQQQKCTNLAESGRGRRQHMFEADTCCLILYFTRTHSEV